MRQRIVMFMAMSLIGFCWVLAATPRKKPEAPSGLLQYPPRSGAYLVQANPAQGLHRQVE